MKKVLFSLVLVLNLVACIKETPKYALFTGKIDNIDNKEVWLIKADKSFSKKITFDLNGNFADTIKANFGLYLLTVGKKSSSIYIGNESAINIKADANDLKASLYVSGKGAETTSYIMFKHKMMEELKGKGKDVYKLEEGDFKNKFQEIDMILNAKLDTAQGIGSAFKSFEKRNLKYNYLLELSRYATGYHSYWAKKRDYKPSEGFLVGLDTLDINNEEDFLLSTAFEQLVTNYYVGKIRDLAKKDSIDFIFAKLKVHSTISNQTIKNALIFSGAEYGMVKAENFEDYYQIFMNASTNEENNAKVTAIYHSLLKINKGQPSPIFTDYENNAGGTLSIEDLKGKYTYIDIWATWCGPCIGELPHLKRLVKKYHGRNINFLSISIDEPKDHDKWKKMIVDKELGGIQVMADKAAQSEFAKEYFITSIPRFILIDPEGTIVTKQAPRPSSPDIIDLFNSLNI